MGIWDVIGRDQIDRVVYEGLAMTNGSSGQNDAAQAVLNAASALGYPSSDISAIFNGFTSTGYSITSPSVQLVAEVPSLTSAGGNNAADPGETVSFKMNLTNNGSEPVLVEELLVEFLDDTGLALETDYQYSIVVPTQGTYNARGNSLIDPVLADCVDTINVRVRR